MSEDPTISYTYQIGGADPQPADPQPEPTAARPAPEAATADLHALDHCEILDLPDANVLLVNKSNGSQITVSRDVSIALRYCQEFRTLRDHARFLVAYMPELGGDESGVQQVLESVRDAGLMASAADICRRIGRDTGDETGLAPTQVCIITCDRPDAVERLLESMLRGANLSKHKALYLVDDSRDSLNAARNQSAVESFNLTCPRTMTYFGATEQLQLQEKLVAALPDQRPAIEFLLDRDKWPDQKTYGRARTLCLLLSVGDRCIIMDDDVLCAAVASPHKETGLKFADKMREADFYTSAQAWQSATVPADTDPLEGHALCLGMPLKRALKSLGFETLEPRDLGDGDFTLLHSLRADSPVLMTQCGSMGDPGVPGNSWLANLEPASQARMNSARGGLQAALENRQYWLGETTPTFSKRATMSQVTGLDNSHTLPPYFPIFRGEDLIFGATLDFLYPHSLSLEYDWAVPHLPIEERAGNPAGDSTKVMGNLELAVDYIADKRPPDSDSSFTTRLDILCGLLLEVSESSDAAIMGIFRAELAKARVDTLRSLSDKLRSSSGQPQQWVDYLRRCLAENVETLQSNTTPRNIRGIPADLDDEAILSQIKKLAGEYAMALRAWPAIRAAAAGTEDR